MKDEIKVKILPYTGQKYYGTELVIEYKGLEYPITLWRSCYNEPSTRELKIFGITKKQYKNNELVDNGFAGKSPAQECELFDGSHYESQITLDLARLIKRKLEK